MPMRLSGLITGMDTESLVGQLMSAQSLKKKKVSDAKTKLEWKQTAWKEMNTKLMSFYNGSLSKMRLSSSYYAKKATLSDSSKASISAGVSAVNGNYTMEVKDIASAQFVTSAKTGITSTDQKLSEMDGGAELIGKKIKIGDKELEITEDTKVSDFIKTATSAGVNASYDTTQKKFFISSKNTGAENSFSITDDADGKALGLLGLKSVEATENDDGTVSYKVGGQDFADGDEIEGGMAVVGAKDSRILLNGALLTSSTSTVSANGLEISLTSKTQPGQSVSFSVTNDVDAVYNNVKKMLKEYNDLMTDMKTKLNAESAKGYDPLTSEEKKAMSDDEVEEWEKKIKDSLLRRDSTLDGIYSSMRSAMMATTEVNGKTFSLSSFGIMTSMNYQEGGLLHIYGDEDDAEYSAQSDMLKKALADNPEETAKALSNIFDGLRSNLFDKMRATEYSSALTFYEDIQMNKDMDQYKKDLSDWDDKLAAMEDSYYKKFAAMESAMAKLQSQQSSLASLFGG